MFYQRSDGAIYVGEPWPEETLFADEFLRAAVYPWLAVGDGIVTLRVENGTASYGLCGYELLRNAHRGVLGPGATWSEPSP